MKKMKLSVRLVGFTENQPQYFLLASRLQLPNIAFIGILSLYRG